MLLVYTTEQTPGSPLKFFAFIIIIILHVFECIEKSQFSK